MLVSVIIPAWNLWHFTESCLRSLAKCSVGEDLEVLVVDNGSTDATASELESLGRAIWGEKFKALRLPENLGFARACNWGAQRASGDLLFFLNNDTTCTPGWLPPLRAAFADSRLGAAGPLLLYPDGTVQHCGIVFTPFCKAEHLYAHISGGHPLISRKRSFQAITGAAFMVRAELFRRCGGFFEGYLNGCEDVDLSFCIRDHGYSLTVVADSKFIHYTSQTPGRFEHEKDNGQLFYTRWGRKIVQDQDRMFRRDGLQIAIGPALDCWPVLPAREEQALNTSILSQPVTPEQLKAQLKEHPFWQAGWLRLIQKLMDQSAYKDAFNIGMSALRISSSEVLLHSLFEVLQKGKSLFPEQEWTDNLAYIQRRMADISDQSPAILRKRCILVEEACQWATRTGNTTLATHLKDWLRQERSRRSQAR